MEYKKIEIREINGYTVTSRTLKLTEEEEQKKFSEIRSLLTRIAAKNQKDKTA